MPETERFRADLARLCDIDGVRLLVAVSGGADSLALLLLVHRVLGDRMEAATVDHGLRSAAAGEAAFVARVCADRGIVHRTLTGTLPARAGRTANLSARARVLRYALLEERRAETGCTQIATAHHADDQLETLIMRLNRGSGIAGLAGVRPKGTHIIRPLLGWRRAELAAVVANAGLAPIIDPSNTDDRFDRARVRKDIATADWLDTASWSQSAMLLGEAEAALQWAVEQALDTRFAEQGDGATLHLTGDEPAEIVRRLVIAGLLAADRQIDCRGDEVMRLVARIQAVRPAGSRPLRATLGGVLVESAARRSGGLTVAFRPAPPRRTPKTAINGPK